MTSGIVFDLAGFPGRTESRGKYPNEEKCKEAERMCTLMQLGMRREHERETHVHFVYRYTSMYGSINGIRKDGGKSAAAYSYSSGILSYFHDPKQA